MSSAFDITIVSEAIEKGADFILNKKQNLDEVLDPIIKSIQQQKQSVNSENFVEKTTFQKSNDAPKIIAILEDEETFSLNLQWILNSLAKKTVIHSFSNSADFIGALIENTQFDFVFSDLYLDESTLKDAMEFIKNKIPNSKLVVLSAQADVNDAIELKTRGIDYFIKKDTNWKFNFLNVLRKLELY